MKWEYKVINLSKSDSNTLLEEFLNSYAINGWEFVSVLGEDDTFYRLLLKRNKCINIK